MRFFLGSAIFFLLLLPSLLFAEFYKYRDADGILRFTDNIVEVPKSQQKRIEEYREIKVVEEAGEVSEIQDLEDVAERLEVEKEVLATEFEQLELERRQLAEASKVARPPEENALFEQKIKDYNARLRQYEEKRMRFKEKVDTYNEVLNARFD